MAGAISVGLLVVAAVLVYAKAEQGLRAQARSRVRATAALAEQLVEEQTLRFSDLVQTHAQLLGSLSEQPLRHLTAAERPVVERALEALLQATPGLRAAALISPGGRLLVSDPPMSALYGRSFASRDWFHGVTTLRSPYVSRVFLAADGPKTVTVAALVRAERSNRLIAILTAGLQGRTQQLADAFERSQGIGLTITDQSGSVVASSGASSNALFSLADAPGVRAALSGRATSRDSHGLLTSYEPVPSTGWTVSASVPVSVAYRSADDLKAILIVVTLVLGALMAAATAALVYLLRGGERAQREDAERLRALLESREVAQRELFASRARLRAIFDHVPGGLSLRDLDGRYLHVNEYIAQALGRSADELVGQDPADHHETAEVIAQIRADDEQMRSTGEPTTQEVNLTHADGSTHDYLVVKYPVTDSEGVVNAFGSFSLDITERKQAEDTNRHLAAIVESAEDAVIAKRLDGTITQWNPAATRLWGYTSEEAIGRPITMLVPVERLGEEEDLLRRITAGEPIVQHETVRVRKDGRRVHVSLTLSPLRGRDGAVVGACTIARDISERKRFEGQLQYLADHDSLTGLFNRRRFEEELRSELARAGRYKTRGAVLAIDLDHFKYVNDSRGHSAGDELISHVGATFRQRLRETDVLARIGGDEFAVLLPETDEPRARLVAASLLDALRSGSAVNPDAGATRVTASIGIAGFHGPHELTADDLMVEADIAMYDAKEAGRNRVAVYEAEEGRKRRMQARLGWSERIRDALAHGNFVLHAQPILALTGDETPRYELLLRMLGDNGDLVPPGMFLYIAERLGLVEDIDLWVLREAIAILAREQREGRDVRLEVNLSAKSITDPALPDVIAQELETAGADPHGLCLEVTETTAIVNVDRARRFANRLTELGCEFALDDFGAGFASFYYLKHLSFDFLKIDGEFIKDIARNPIDQLVVRSLVQLAHGLGKRTIAEFVSDEEGLDLIRRYGVDYAQGFYLGRPVPIPEGGLKQQAPLVRG